MDREERRKRFLYLYRLYTGGDSMPTLDDLQRQINDLNLCCEDVNEEITALKSEIDKSTRYDANKTSLWEQGSISSTGGNSGGTKRIRTIGYLDNLYSVVNNDFSGYEFIVCGYSKTDLSFLGRWNGTAWATIAWGNQTAILSNLPDAYYRLVIRNSDNTSVIVPDEADCLELNKYIDANYISTQQNIIGDGETSYTATKNYSIGDFVIVANTLYKVTAAIATGATITPGTNCVATTVAEQLILLANA